jgi:hypothetical protein
MVNHKQKPSQQQTQKQKSVQHGLTEDLVARSYKIQDR